MVLKTLQFIVLRNFTFHDEGPLFVVTQEFMAPNGNYVPVSDFCLVQHVQLGTCSAQSVSIVLDEMMVISGWKSLICFCFHGQSKSLNSTGSLQGWETC